MSDRKAGLGSIRALARAAAELDGVNLGGPTEAVRAFKGLVDGSGSVGDPLEDFREFLNGPGWQKAQQKSQEAPDDIVEDPEKEARQRLRVLRGVMFRASTIDEAEIQRRRPLLGNTALVGTLSLLAGSGGRGKSVLQLARAIALASGREITGERLHEGAKRVGYLNLEDPRNEIQMRAAGICRAHGIPLPENLILVSGLDLPFECTVAIDEEGSATVNIETIQMLDGFIRENALDALFLDPVVRLHTFSENDNTKIDFAVRQLARMSVHHQIAISLAHHMSRAAAASRSVEGGGRGASSLTDGVRNAEVMHRASPDEVEAMIRDHGEALVRVTGANLDAWRFIYLMSSKINYAPPVAGRQWFYLRSIKLLNGDEVGVPVPFTLSPKVATSGVFLLAEVAAHVFESTGGRGGSNTPISLNAAASWLAKKHNKNRTTYHRELQTILSGGKELLLSDGTTVHLKDNSQGRATLFFNFDGREDSE